MWFGANVATFSVANYFARVSGVGTALRYSPTNATTVTTGTATTSLVAGQLYPILVIYGVNGTTNYGISIEWQAPSAVGSGAAGGWNNQATVSSYTYLLTDNVLHYRWVSGYWNGSVSTFNTLNMGGESWINSFYLANIVGAVNRSAAFYGWFVPNETGTWLFEIGSEDKTSLWIGENALPQNQTDTNYLVAITTDSTTAPASRLTTATISLVSGVYYPICIMHGMANVASSQLQLIVRVRKPSDGGTTRRAQLFPYLRCVHPNNVYTIGSTVVDITSQGTSTYGNHAFLKSYLVNSSTTTQTFRTQMNLTNYIDASLALNSSFVAFSFENGVSGFGIHNISPSSNVFSLAKYKRYTVSVNPTVGASTTDITVTNGSRHTYVIGKTWVIPIQVIDEYDGFYRANHGLTTGNVVTINLYPGQCQLESQMVPITVLKLLIPIISVLKQRPGWLPSIFKVLVHQPWNLYKTSPILLQTPFIAMVMILQMVQKWSMTIKVIPVSLD
jgi:hypothetical protein